MCTGLAINTPAGFFFGRNMDIDRSFGERVVIVPRHYQFSFLHEPAREAGYALIGMGSVIENMPLYAEAANEKGLCVAGLNFPGFAKYAEAPQDGHFNVSAPELISWLLTRFASVAEARADLVRLNLLGESIRPELPVPPMHWLLADQKEAIVIEATTDGLRIHDNPVGVLTNSPTFDWHLTNLRQYMGLRPEQPAPANWSDLALQPLGEGVGGVGLPGDASPPSRFVRAAFLRNSAAFGDSEDEAVSQFFHVLDAVAMVRGNVVLPNGNLDLTTYASCIAVERGAYFYKTAGNSQLNVVNLHDEKIDGIELIVHELRGKQSVYTHASQTTKS